MIPQEFSLLILTVFMLFVLVSVQKNKRVRQLAYIQAYVFHPVITNRVKNKYPHLSDDQIDMVFESLKDYFLFCNQAKMQQITMPSQVVNVAWYEFMLFSRFYGDFSQQALGRLLQYTPATALKLPLSTQTDITSTWCLACAKENIDPMSPTRLPLLFAIDSLLGINDGFKYPLNCQDNAALIYGAENSAGLTG